MQSTFAGVALLEDRLPDLRTRGREDQRRPATEALLRELQGITRDHGARILVAILESRDEPKEHYLKFAASRGIEAVDCTVPNHEQLQVPGYSHPIGESMRSGPSALATGGEIERGSTLSPAAARRPHRRRDNLRRTGLAASATPVESRVSVVRFPG